MKRMVLIAFLAALAVAAAVPGYKRVVLAQDDAKREQIERGRYLVENVAQCIQCHTPRDTEGNLIRAKLLQGAPIPVGKPYPNHAWAERAPSIAGLAGFGEEGVKYLLMNGKAKRTGQPPSAPMPPFLMSEADADAVVAYLVSLRKSN